MNLKQKNYHHNLQDYQMECISEDLLQELSICRKINNKQICLKIFVKSQIENNQLMIFFISHIHIKHILYYYTNKRTKYQQFDFISFDCRYNKKVKITLIPMSSLIDQLVQQFQSKSQYDNFCHEIQQKFDINTYRFQQMTPSMARKAYNQLRSKYQQNILTQTHRNWHETERRTFVWFLLVFLKHLKDNHLRIVIKIFYEKQQQHWQQLSQTFFNKDILFLKYQYHAIQKTKKRQQWSEEQDEIMISCQEYYQAIRNTNWNEIAKEIFFRTRGESYKSSKQCRQRWQNHLDNKIKKEGWEIDEDLIILKYVLENSKKWSKIVQVLNNTRTQHMVKNRFKSLLSKYQSQLKQENKQFQNQNQLIQHLIKQLTTSNENADYLISTSEMKSQMKDILIEDLPDIKLNGQTKSHGILTRDDHGEFTIQPPSIRSSQVFSIFECRSPAALSVNSNGLLFSRSYNLITPPAGINTRECLSNLNFGTFQQRWNKIEQKSSITQETENINITTNFIQCGRREENLRFSFQFNNLESGVEKTHSQGGLLSTPMIKAIQNHLIFNLTPTQSNPLENSDYYMSTLDSNLVLKEESGKANQTGLKQEQKD